LCAIVSRETIPAILRLQRFILRDKFSTVSTVSTKVFNNQTKFSTGFQQVFNRYPGVFNRFSTANRKFSTGCGKLEKYHGTLI